MPPIDTPYTEIPKSEPSTNPLGLSIPGSTLDSARLGSARLQACLGPGPDPGSRLSHRPA